MWGVDDQKIWLQECARKSNSAYFVIIFKKTINRKPLDFIKNKNNLPVGFTRCSCRLTSSTIIIKVTYIPYYIDIYELEMNL